MHPALPNTDESTPTIECSWPDIPEGLARARPVNYNDVKRALETIGPTVTDEMKRRFAAF